MNLKQLAKTLNLSQTTVSRALNGYPEVSEATRERVREAARRHNYRPNPAAMRLAKGATGNIGLVLPADADGALDPHFGAFLSGVSDTCARMGYDVLIAPGRLSAADAAFERLLGGSHVDGMILPGTRVRDERVARAIEAGLPLVVHGRTARPEAGYSFLDIDNRDAFARLTQHLVAQGHRRIGLVNADPEYFFAAEREAGWVDALEASGLPQSRDLVRSGAMSESFGYEAASDLLGRERRPTAIVSARAVAVIRMLFPPLPTALS